MKAKQMCVIYDSKADRYNPPFSVHTYGEAERGFKDLVNDKTTAIGQHPEDFILFSLGEWDDDKGILLPLVEKQSLGNGIDFLVKTEK